ncbi:MAG: SDR family oxidoreductase [Bacteroidetes bacterium]|nr:MAG: SDR family oxidoreductase [Bacteroidota bacterium]
MTNDDHAPVYAIIGATGGIGADLTRRLAGRGGRLVLGARTEADVRALADEVGAEAYPLDATDFEQVQGFVRHALDTHGRIDGIANLAGSILLKPAHLTSLDEFNQTLALNLHTAFHTVKAAARAMMKEGGSIVLMTTAAARIGVPNHEAIAAAKGGVIGLTRAAAATYANRGVRVNCIAPGLVASRMSEHLVQNEAGRKQSEAMHALGRIGQPGDVAPAIAWLLSAESSWVTGQVIGVDGGLATVRGR